MSYSGYMLRCDQALAARGDALCECGHRVGGHRELQPKWELRDGELVGVEHPDYRPFHFHCERDGCSCVRTV